MSSLPSDLPHQSPTVDGEHPWPNHSDEWAEEIRIRGTVQGVGFRPTVYRLARHYSLRGVVWNDGEGVLIRAAGSLGGLDGLVEALQRHPPPLARIESIHRSPLNPQVLLEQDFQIIASRSTTVRTEVPADAATCPECFREIFSPTSRWYRYPFTNCTHCGPRFSIMRAIPYDRGHTSMADFPMCPACQQDYEEVTNRRFHAQPIACAVCGPKVWLELSNGDTLSSSHVSYSDDIDVARSLLQRGEIIAIKGIGGIHLACDATNEATVQRLRQRKRRYHKPFALMARSLEVIEQYCLISSQERELLESPSAPIVLLRLRPGDVQVAPSVAPGLTHLGFMLPHTPLHHLLLRRIQRPLVMTSGNLSDEPQCISNEEARQRLGTIADYLLLHNRDIVNRVDDSVVRVVEQRPQVLRRSRGYAPMAVKLPAGFEQAPSILAMGGELKNTFCLLQAGEVLPSPHLGDLENSQAFAAYQQMIGLYRQLFQHQPAAIAVDLHPEYLSSKLGQDWAEQMNLPLLKIQHHHAHIVACMVEHHLPLDTTPVLGIVLDGLGYGADGQLWGGEFLLADYRDFQRLASLKPIPLLGGAQAMRQPWRNTYAHLHSAFSDNFAAILEQKLDLFDFLRGQPVTLLNQMLAQGLNCPLASSAGRLFDAVAAALGCWREGCSYEGQAAIALENLAAEYLTTPAAELRAQEQAYSFEIIRDLRSDQSRLVLDPRPLWHTLVNDLQTHVEPAVISARFHLGLVGAIAATISELQSHMFFDRIVLSGGVFQNEVLLTVLQRRLQAMHLEVLSPSLLPPNDGGLSVGQAAIASARLIEP